MGSFTREQQNTGLPRPTGVFRTADDKTDIPAVVVTDGEGNPVAQGTPAAPTVVRVQDGAGAALAAVTAALSLATSIRDAATGNAATVISGALSVASARQATTVFNQASASQTAGNSGPLTVATMAELSVDVNVTAFTGGTAPAITFFVDRQGADGIWYQIYAGAAITAAGTQSASLGAGLGFTGGGQNSVSFGGTVRLRWTLGGTVPPTAVTFSASIIGK